MLGTSHPDFSPGPWRQELPEPGYRFAQNGDRVVYAANGLAIAMVINDTPPNAEPNAHLIAASHELFHALARILPMAKSYAAEHRVGRNAEFIQQAEAALMKAEGLA